MTAELQATATVLAQDLGFVRSDSAGWPNLFAFKLHLGDAGDVLLWGRPYSGALISWHRNPENYEAQFVIIECQDEKSLHRALVEVVAFVMRVQKGFVL